MRRIILFLSLLSLSAISSAQKIQGVVTDSLGETLGGVTVIAYENGQASDYAITDDAGRFRIAEPTNDSAFLKFTHIGFADQIVPYGLSSVPKPLKVTMKEDINFLKTAEIRQQIPVMVKGDTLVYKADYFTTGREKKLEDVLEKMPAMEVEDGVVKVEGKEVSNIMVEGKEFFDGDSKMAVKNIPADAVDKVEVLKNYNDVEMMKGLGNDDDNIALNIKLKQGKKQFWFGDINASGGPDSRYLANPNLFYYSPKKSINVIGNANTIGDAPFTMRDYFRFSGGMKNLLRAQGASINSVSNDVGLLMMQNNTAKDVSTLFGGLNYNWNPKKKWSFNGFLISNNNQTEFEQNIFSQFQESGLQERQNSLSDQTVNSQLFKFSGMYRPGRDFQTEYNLYIKAGAQNQGTNVQTQFFTNEWKLNEAIEQSSLTVRQDLLTYWTIKPKQIMSMEMSFETARNDRDYLTASEGSLYMDPIGMGLDSVQRLTSSQLNNNVSFNSLVNYYLLIDDQSNLNFTAAYNIFDQSNSNDYSHFRSDEDNRALDSVDNSSSNQFQFADLSIGAHYKRLIGKKLTIRVGANFHSYQTKLEQPDISNQINRVLPDAFVKYQIRKSESLTFAYSMQNRFANLLQLNSNRQLNSYRFVSFGSPNLDFTTIQEFNLSYFKFSMFNMLDIHAMLRYTKSEQPIRSLIALQGIVQNVSFYNSGKFEEFGVARLNVGKQWGRTKWGVDLTYDHSSAPNTVNGIEATTSSQNIGVEFSFRTTFKTKPNVELSMNNIRNNYSIGGTLQKYERLNPELGIDIPLGTWFYLTANYSYSDYRGLNNSVRNTFEFLNASLFFGHEDKPWELRVDGFNLLDNQSFNQDSAGQIQASSSQYVVLGRILQLGFIYKI